MKIHKGDNVIMLAGNDRGRSGKVLRVFPSKGKILVEGINMRKKHIRPRRADQKGEIVNIPVPVPASRAMLVCPKCGKPTRVGYKLSDNGKARICKKCEAEI